MPQFNRRQFFASAASAGLAAAQEKKLKLGIIGCGWYGGTDARAAWKAGGVEVAATCDADSKMLDDMSALCEKEQGAKPKTFKHYKDLLALDGLDAVIIATPPHWHALPFIAACERKLAIYCEKPLAYDIREGRAMVNAWKKAGNLVQVGFQRRQSDAFKAVREYLASGKPGRLVQVDVNIHYAAATPDPKPVPPPPTLDWDLWCGPAPRLPYSVAIGHRSWRLEQTTGNGHLVDWGIHLIDATRKVLGESMPKRITAAGGLYKYSGLITTPDTLTAHFEFDRCPVVWRHRLWGAAELSPEYSNGVSFFCENETIFASDSRWVIMPKGRDARPQVNDIRPASDLGARHMLEFLAALRGGPRPACTPDDAFLSTATVQLGMISYRTGRTVNWDAASENIPGDKEAARLLLRPYRPPYKHPGA
jgi:predicted dehydrogenase